MVCPGFDRADIYGLKGFYLWTASLYWKYIDILKNELIPAMGCTEPIAVAYAGALARKTLGTMPEQVKLTVSGISSKT